MRIFFEEMFFHPKWYHYIVMVSLFPFSLLYGVVMLLRRMFTAKNHFSIPVISVGNLQAGGSGKTPFVIALASRYADVTIISRGYGRESTGLVEVSRKGRVLVDVRQSGDEPMLMAESLPRTSVIVSENRTIAIEVAMREGAKLIFLDDGFNRVNIEKFEILLEPKCLPNILPFPSGPLREFAFTKHYANCIVKEEKDFKRVVSFENLCEKMLLVTAISNPQRLDAYLPVGVVGKIYLEDHAYFDENFLRNALLSHDAKSLLVTQKDAVKMQDFKLPLSLMKLRLEIDSFVYASVDEYIKDFNNHIKENESEK